MNVYLSVRNLLNHRNVLEVFTETQSPLNPGLDFVRNNTLGAARGVRDTDIVIADEPNAFQRMLLARRERLFGNGDGVLDRREQQLSSIASFIAQRLRHAARRVHGRLLRRAAADPSRSGVAVLTGRAKRGAWRGPPRSRAYNGGLEVMRTFLTRAVWTVAGAVMLVVAAGPLAAQTTREKYEARLRRGSPFNLAAAGETTYTLNI